MSAVQQRTVHLGYGVKMSVIDGRLRITFPVHKEIWHLVLLPYAIIALAIGGILDGSVFELLARATSNGQVSPLFWSALGKFLFGASAVLLLIGLILWYLTGCYVLEISNKTIKAGRRLLGRDLLRTFDASNLYRLRFSLIFDNPNKGMPVGTVGRSDGQIWQRNRRVLELDYGSKSFSVLKMALTEEQVNTIKETIHKYFPNW